MYYIYIIHYIMGGESIYRINIQTWVCLNMWYTDVYGIPRNCHYDNRQSNYGVLYFQTNPYVKIRGNPTPPENLPSVYFYWYSRYVFAYFCCVNFQASLGDICALVFVLVPYIHQSVVSRIVRLILRCNQGFGGTAF